MGVEVHYIFNSPLCCGSLPFPHPHSPSSLSPYSDMLEFHAGAGPPSAPHPPTLTTAEVHLLTLHWSPPHDNGSPISSYCLEMEDPESVSLLSIILSFSMGAWEYKRLLRVNEDR